MLRRFFVELFSLAIMIGATFVTPAASQAMKRVALVIGNANYAHEGRLANPANDARAVAATLKRIGFDNVQVVLDGDLKALQAGLAAFARIADTADMALVYYSGHGIEVNGQNYLLPVDARLGDAADVDFEAISLDLVVRATDRVAKVKLIVLDACRNNPFTSRMLQRQGRRSVGRGLAAPAAAGTGMLVAYAARAGTTADDGPAGSNSPFTAAFLKLVEQPGIEVRRLFGQIRDEVVQATRHQEPFTYGSLGGDEVFLHRAGLSVSVGAGQQAPLTPPPAISTRFLEAERVWVTIKDSTSIPSLEAFVARYGDTFYGDLAAARLVGLRQVEAALAAKQGRGDDVRNREESVPAGQAPRDGSANCGLLREAAQCSSAVGCQWWISSKTCVPHAASIGQAASPASAPGASTGFRCSQLTDPARCNSASSCTWWVSQSSCLPHRAAGTR